ncbi:unnamed protein product [Cuscuta campestris]|uniref:Retrovirus-related Pol polyprotein from transposon TNT 1-94-like beta-barrel domain-containing protein n=1 Tax=Cuscuta campestris TaxID=132261 RepID=A0A484LVL0_9ASTE|nr:unnamed protein product [Cuscuta campestris]
MVNNIDHGLPKFSLLGYDDWKIMMEAHLYALHDCIRMVLEDGPLKIQMENPERNPANLDVVQYIPKPKEKWDDRDCKKHNRDNVAKAAIFKTLDPITFSKIKHLKTAMEIWQGLGKLCEGSEDLRKQKIEVLLEKFKSFKMFPRESFDMLDERFHKILNDLASLNHVLSPKEKNVRLLRSLPAEWYTKATAMEEGRNLENYTVQCLLDELRTYEHELKKKKEEQVTPFPTALMTTPRVPSSEGTCPRNCDTPSSSQPSSSKMENYDEEFTMMVKQFRKFNSKSSSRKLTQSEGHPRESHRESVDKLLKATKQKGREGLGFDPSSSKRKGRTTFIPPKPTAKPNKQKGKEKEKPTEVPKKEAAKYPGVWYLDSGCSRHMTGDASLLSNLIPYDGPRVTFGGSNDFGLLKGLGNLVYKGLTIQAVSYVEGLNYNLLSISQFCDKSYSLEHYKDMASLKNICTNEVILTGKRIRNIYEVMWDNVKEACRISKEKMKIVGANVHFQKLEGKCSSPAFYQTYLDLIAAQELSEFPHMEIHSKYEDEVLELYRNGKVKTSQSKKNPQRKIQVIKSTIGGAKVKISQKKLEEKLHLPNSGSEIGRLLAKNLDWKTIGISGQIPSGPAKKADLKNDYKLVLELVIACLECGSGGHADDITQERAFIINALITRTKVNWGKHFFNSISKHLGKPKHKYLCHGLYLGYILESLGVASEGKKYEARYWLYYLASKGENKVSSTAEDEGSSDNVLIMSLKKSSKRKQVVSPSPSAEAPHTLAVVNLEEEEVSAQGELQRKKKRKITSPSTSGNANPDELVGKEPVEEHSAQNQSPQQLDEENPQAQSFPSPPLQAQTDDAESQFMQLYFDWSAWKVWQRNYDDLHLEHLATTPVSEFEVDDEDPAVYRPIFSKTIEDQMILTSEAQADMEATAEDFQVFPETSPTVEAVLTEENEATPLQEQNQESSEEELLQLLQTQVQEILTTPCEISNKRELEIPEKSEENLEREAQMAGLETSETPVAIFEQNIGDEDKDSLSRDISNFVNETEEESEMTLRIDDEEAEQGDAESLPLQLFHRAPPSHQMDIRPALAVSSANQVVTQDYLKVIAKNQKEAFKMFRHFGTYTGKRKLDQSNPENSMQHVTDTGLDGTEAVGTIASHFSNDAQTKERYNNLRRIKEECGFMQGIGETARSSKRKKR